MALFLPKFISLPRENESLKRPRKPPTQPSTGRNMLVCKQETKSGRLTKAGDLESSGKFKANV